MQVPQESSASALPPHVLLTSVGVANLAQLLASLIQARKKFDPSARDHGRAGVYHALLAVDHYISELFPQRPEVNHTLRELLYSLRGLDKGTVGPLVTPVKIKHRPPNPISQSLLRADAAVLMQLKRWEKVGRAEAADSVARALNRLGYRDSGQRITGKQVALWRGQMRKAAEEPDPAAKRYQDVLRSLKAAFPKDPRSAFKYYLERVKEMLPPTISKKVALK
jgi:hypothetical protein